MTLAASLAERVLQGLHKQVGDAALAVGDADVQGHGHYLLAGQHLAHEDLAHHRPVAVGDDQLVVHLHDGQQRYAGVGGDVDLLLDRTLDIARVKGVAADGDEEALGDFRSLAHSARPIAQPCVRERRLTL